MIARPRCWTLANQLTIEQLAAESGMSVRNIRAHQARGLLAPPEVRLRVGYYGPEHVAQLRLIRELQDDGFNLGGIKRLLDDTPGDGRAAAAVQAGAERRRPASEPAETLTSRELGERFRVTPEEAPAVLAKAQTLGMLVPVGGDSYEAPSPSLLAVAEEVVRAWYLAAECAGRFRGDRAPLRLHVAGVREAVHARGVEAVRAGRHAADRWPEIEQADRATATDRLRGAADDLPAATERRRSRGRSARSHDGWRSSGA